MTNEGIKWYSKGKFEPAEDNEYDTVEGSFEVGQKINVKEITYWEDSKTKGTMDKPGEWKKYTPPGSSRSAEYVISKVDYCNSIDGYTGQIIKLNGCWPWFRSGDAILK